MQTRKTTTATTTTTTTPFCLTSAAPSGGSGKHMILSQQQVGAGAAAMGCLCSREAEYGEPTPEENRNGRKEWENVIPDNPSPRRVVAFTAKLDPAHSTPYHSGVLKLTHVLLNEGNAYDQLQGIFTCPLVGLYHFTVHMSLNGRAQCALYRNGESLASLYHTSLPNGCSQVASVSSTVALEVGDQVWVNLWGHGRHEIIATEDSDTVLVGFFLG